MVIMISKTQDSLMQYWPKVWNVPMVSIRCTTYNHESYIRQAIDGFLMQETTFPFEVVIHDDASTDRTADIIREYEVKYPRIIKPIYEIENQYSKRDGSLAKIVDAACVGKYIALCEGDDFWTDAKKLQKQVDFLENNPDYGMCYTNFNVYLERNKSLQKSCFSNQPQKYTSEYDLKKWIVSGGYVAPMTWLVRNNLWQNRRNDKISSPDGTFVYFAFFLRNSRVFCLKNETTATYRIIKESAVHTTFLKNAYQRFRSLHKTQLTLVDKYLEGAEKKEAINVINKKYYKLGLKLFVAFDDKEEINQAKKWMKKNLITSMLFLISRIKCFRLCYLYLYRLYYKVK
jgi:glycosyltransferase involved in cell wall biosynthesis